jgi:thymidylate synthase (FAD)
MKILDHGEVTLIDSCADDKMVLMAMLVSTGKDATFVPGDEVRAVGRINYLMRNKHGTPFEHNFLCFRITAPIFVIREWHRHRIGSSYNEQSGRYMELSNKWYIPDPENVRTRVGKAGHYTYEQLNYDDAQVFIKTLDNQCQSSYNNYKNALEYGVAPEQARMFLHVNHYSSFYYSCNARSLMKFLELRASNHAQWEIYVFALALEEIFAELMPLTYQAFIDNGRIAP